MNKNGRIKPNLLDPMIEKKIVKTLQIPKDNFWVPTKNSFVNCYKKYMRPNIFLIIFIIVIIIFLIYRYRVVKKKKLIVQICDTQNKKSTGQNDFSKKNINDNIEALLYVYNQQKENLREPIVEGRRKKINNSKLAYPMYPYEGGTLAPSGNR